MATVREACSGSEEHRAECVSVLGSLCAREQLEQRLPLGAKSGLETLAARWDRRQARGGGRVWREAHVRFVVRPLVAWCRDAGANLTCEDDCFRSPALHLTHGYADPSQKTLLSENQYVRSSVLTAFVTRSTGLATFVGSRETGELCVLVSCHSHGVKLGYTGCRRF